MKQMILTVTRLDMVGKIQSILVLLHATVIIEGNPQMEVTL